MKLSLALAVILYFNSGPVEPHIRYIPPFYMECQVTEPESEDCALIAQAVWGEARGCSVTEQAAVIWCILNRVDAGYGTIREVITSPKQFTGWKRSNPITQEHLDLAEDVWNRWMLEKAGVKESGRVLPKEYLWFAGDGKHNYFRDAHKGGSRWDWGLESPYEEDHL